MASSSPARDELSWAHHSITHSVLSYTVLSSRDSFHLLCPFPPVAFYPLNLPFLPQNAQSTAERCPRWSQANALEVEHLTFLPLQGPTKWMPRITFSPLNFFHWLFVCLKSESQMQLATVSNRYSSCGLQFLVLCWNEASSLAKNSGEIFLPKPVKEPGFIATPSSPV